MSYQRVNQYQLFDRIYDVWHMERANIETLVPLKAGFYSDLRMLLERFSRKIEAEKDDVIKKILETRLERLNYVVDDLIEIRTMKIVHHVIKKKTITVNLAQEEYSFYSNLEKIHDIFIKGIFNPKEVAFINDLEFLETKKEEKAEENGIEYVNLRFIKKIDQEIMGVDGEVYGPFNPEDICVLPKENAVGLVKREVAEKIEIDK
ncbi:MAG: DNA replication complex subunit Gins51 [Candidatus Heimdallarchaeaceae archaeon]